MTTVLVVARSPGARARLERALASTRGLRCVSVPSGAPLGPSVHGVRAALALIDLGDEPIDSALRLGRDPAPPGLVVLAEDPHRVMADPAMQRGLVRGVLPRDATSGEIAAAVEAARAGLLALHPLAVDALRHRAPQAAGDQHSPVQSLTAREIEVLAMVSEGLGNKAIAGRLGNSAHTAKFHVASIMAKLGAGSRTEAVTIGMRRGLVVI